MLFLASTLLFTHTDFFQFLKDWWALIVFFGGLVVGQYKWILKRADELAAEAKVERARLEEESKKELKRIEQEASADRKKLRDEAGDNLKKLTDLLTSHHERINQVEETDRNAYPVFKNLCEDYKKLEETVKNHHETRFTGIVGNIEMFSKLYEAKLESANQRVNDLEKRLDKIDMKLDKIFDAISEIKRH